MGTERGKNTTDKTSESEGSVKAIISELYNASTESGIGRVVLSPSLFYRLFWSLTYLFVTFALLTNLYLIIDGYFQYKTIQETRIVQQVPDFPDVTFCSNSPFSTESFFDSRIPRETQRQVTEFHDFRRNLSETGNFTDSVRSLYLVSADFANVGPQLAPYLGHQQKDLIVKCSFNGRLCSALGSDTITHHISPTYLNCFTFNGKNVHTEEMETGVEGSLSLILHSEEARVPVLPEYYMGNTENQDGMVLSVNEQGTVPDFNNGGFDILPGTSTSVALSAISRFSLEEPYGECQESAQIPYRNYTYTASACLSLCLQKVITRECFCIAADYLVFDDVSANMTYCRKYEANNSQNFLDDVNCKLKNAKKVKQDTEKYCGHCKKMCSEKFYDFTLSQAVWPTESRVSGFIDVFVKPRNGTQYHEEYKDIKALPNITAAERESQLQQWVRNHFYRVNIYFPYFSVRAVEQKPMMEQADLLSNIGGVFGLWAGISLTTGVEILEFTVKFFSAILFRKKKRMSVKSTI